MKKGSESTPRTDAKAAWALGEFGPHNNQRFAAMCDFARELEREGYELVRLVQRIIEDMDCSGDEIGAKQLRLYLREIEAQAWADKLEKAGVITSAQKERVLSSHCAVLGSDGKTYGLSYVPSAAPKVERCAWQCCDCGGRFPVNIDGCGNCGAPPSRLYWLSDNP